MIEAIIFDAEGVVIDTEGLWDEAQEQLLGRRGIAYDRARLKPMLTGRSALEGARVLCDVLGLDDGPEDLARERMEVMHHLLRSGIDFMDGFEPFFQRVGPRLPHAIATAMDPALFAVADAALGLRSMFDGRVVTLDDVGGVGKPAPDLFREAARRLGTPPARCLVVEDAPHGVEAARRAGMRSAGLATTHAPETLLSADQVCSTFAEIDLSAAGFAGAESDEPLSSTRRGE